MKVLIFGGTHGNEWTGIYVIKKYADQLRKDFPRLDLEFILANPEAHKLNKRFKDEDLNRAFQFLAENRLHSYEHLRARELKSIIDREPCFIIDLHTTTSNMGTTAIITQYNHHNFFVASELIKAVPECRVIGSPDPKKKYLGSQSDLGLMIEVGPVANGILESSALEYTLRALRAILGALNQNYSEELAGEIELYEEAQDVSYPREASGELSAYIHPDLQGKDFIPLRGKFKAFRTFAGDELELESREELFPIFINEAAYYPVHLAFSLCRKIVRNF